MTPFEQFVQELVSKIQLGSPPLDCSRIDLALSSETGAVVVLLYTQPQLTERMLNLPPFQYPLPLLLNNHLLYQYVEYDIRTGRVTPTLSELMRASMVGLTQYNSYGTMISSDGGDDSNLTWYVPLVEFGDNASHRSRLWSTVLLDPQYPVSVINDDPGVVQLVVVHIPDYSIFELSNEQLLHITRLTLGWNYCRVLRDDELQHIAEVFLAAKLHAHTIAEF